MNAVDLTKLLEFLNKIKDPNEWRPIYDKPMEAS
jgi:hypothetical protein